MMHRIERFYRFALTLVCPRSSVHKLAHDVTTRTHRNIPSQVSNAASLRPNPKENLVSYDPTTHRDYFRWPKP